MTISISDKNTPTVGREVVASGETVKVAEGGCVKKTCWFVVLTTSRLFNHRPHGLSSKISLSSSESSPLSSDGFLAAAPAAVGSAVVPRPLAGIASAAISIGRRRQHRPLPACRCRDYDDRYDDSGWVRYRTTVTVVRRHRRRTIDTRTPLCVVPGRRRRHDERRSVSRTGGRRATRFRRTGGGARCERDL